MKKSKLIILIIIPVAIILGIGVYNFFTNEEFWSSSATTCISLLTAAALSFYVVQRQNDYRKQKDIFIQLLESLKDIIDDDRSYNFDSSSKEEILMIKRTLNNKIDFIKNYSEKFSIQKEVKFIEDKFLEYNDIIGNHIDDITTLKKLHNDLKRPLLLISQKIFEIMLNLYN